ncbi:MAG: hypothetical protein U9R43_13835 [Thermodesulfobacteriota bacterium]|nr:hypothetical protein [Thermodesulfobacteriota bacterium]
MPSTSVRGGADGASRGHHDEHRDLGRSRMDAVFLRPWVERRDVDVE